VSDPVLGDEGADRGAERFLEQVHGVVRMQVVGFGDPFGSERFMVVARDVTGQLVGA